MAHFEINGRGIGGEGNKAGEPKSAVIIGAGLVGSLAAVYFAEAGWTVHLYEQRSDMRNEQYSRERSINLAVSHRGLTALHGAAGVDVEALLATAVPMKGRMIHPRGGDGGKGAQAAAAPRPESQPYGLHGETLQSMDRRKLNEQLLDCADRLPNVTLHFDHELRGVDVSAGVATFFDRRTRGTVRARGELVVGCDGAHSAVRAAMLRPARMRFAQEYIDHCYLELTMPAVARGTYVPWAMEPNHLHIWPRHEYMLIALPNPDGSFTCTLFAPWRLIEGIKTMGQLRRLFAAEFTDAVPFLPDLETEFFNNPRGPLISIECGPYFCGKALILGDAAHAMVPFYGQGLNCGLEDVVTLFRHLREAGVTSTLDHDQRDVATSSPVGGGGPGSGRSSPAVLSPVVSTAVRPGTPPSPSREVAAAAAEDPALQRALAAYSREREPDAAAMCQLALANYAEMRSHVVAPRYRARRAVGRVLARILPSGWLTPQYSLVAFSTTPYSECARQGRRAANVADAVVAGAAATTALAGSAAVAVLVHRLARAGGGSGFGFPGGEGGLGATISAIAGSAAAGVTSLAHRVFPTASKSA